MVDIEGERKRLTKELEDAEEEQINLNSMNLMSALGEERFGGPNNNYIKEYFNEGNVILDGLYSWDELKILKNEFKDDLCVLAIVVNKSNRYERLNIRKINIHYMV